MKLTVADSFKGAKETNFMRYFGNFGKNPDFRQNSGPNLDQFGPSYGHRWARLTGWPVFGAVGGPVGHGGIPPYVYLQHVGPSMGTMVLDLPWWTKLLGHRWARFIWVTCVYGCRWTCSHTYTGVQHGGHPPMGGPCCGAQVDQVNWVACGYGYRWTS